MELFEDQTQGLSFDEADLEDSGVIGQEIWRNYVNDLGPADESTLQVDFIDFTEEDELYWSTAQDDLDIAQDALLVEEFEIKAEPVPDDWQYWNHEESTIPPVDESTAPQLPSGWVDPDTGELIP